MVTGIFSLTSGWKAQANLAVHQAYTLVPNAEVVAIPVSVSQTGAYERILHGSHMLTVNNKCLCTMYY